MSMDLNKIKELAMLVSTKRHNDNFEANYYHSKWFYVGSHGINDPNVNAVIDDYDGYGGEQYYIEQFRNWIKAYPHHSITGMDEYIHVYGNGCTQGFDSFYMANHTRRFRMFPEEYPYHYVQLKSSMNYEFMHRERMDLQVGDAVILSLPYANTGTAHPLTEQILQECNEKSIPVLLDLCYYFISEGLDVDLSHPCIDTVTFGLSKLFPVGHSRIGMRLSRDYKDGQNIYHEHKYFNERSMGLGQTLMDHFSPEYIYNKYKATQLEICEYLEIEPSASILFGLTEDPEFMQYSRDIMGKQHGIMENDSAIYRAGIVNLLEEWDWIKNAIGI